MKTIKRELVRTGTFGRLNGQKVTITPQIIADIKETFDGKSPVTLGHTLADWMPKFGNAKTLSPESTDSSIVSELEINDALADAVDEKFYDDLSVGIERRASDGKHYLHHVGFLGAVPPKIRDLKVFADIEILHLGDQAGTVITIGGEDSKVPGDTPRTHAADSGEQEDEVDQRLKEENEDLKKRLSDVSAEHLAGAKAALKQAMDGRIPKAKQGLVLALADQLGVDDKIELADESGTKTAVDGVEILRRVLESIPKLVNEGRAALGDDEEKKPLDLSGIRGKV